ncbi:two-component system response regulator BaeR [Photobacterium proteolyticum]|uniref:Two-component system response regulator BaeR n=1 Tax=Photobacterium proteolyticum TaxID=1903952 RepID=A0A1Q9GD44_9GAMM|nr:response regulator [Photobacterium proteolyticum]OLQ72239.1 two-component system response regulator BaeR [Photobacterium proteolyticum]
MEHILVVEDEVQLATLTEDYLKASGYRTDALYEGIQVIEWVKANDPALILLDCMLPGKDGVSLCREIRTFSNVPIIMVTAKIDEVDRLVGLEIGADDYICKPCSLREVVARVKAVLRRHAVIPENFIQDPVSEEQEEVLHLDKARFKATLKGSDLDLTAVEFAMLDILAASPGRVYSRAQLMEAIYRDNRIVSERTIDSHIKKLRKKFTEVQPDYELIHSVYGAGYKLEY